MKRSTNLRAGFSLIELLVVIAIIVIVMSMLMPNMIKLKERTRTIACRSNLRQAAQFHMQFAIEKGYFASPNRWVRQTGHREGGVWADFAKEQNVIDGEMWEYTHDLSVYKCPVFEKVFRTHPFMAHITEIYSSYCMNEFFNGGWQGAGAAYGSGYAFKKVREGTEDKPSQYVDLSLVMKPSNLIILGEENYFITNIYNNHAINNLALGVGNYNAGADSTVNVVDGLASFHDRYGDELIDGYSYACFVDGHVEQVHGRDSKKLATPHRVKMSKHGHVTPDMDF